jgi:hypothetical protein
LCKFFLFLQLFISFFEKMKSMRKWKFFVSALLGLKQECFFNLHKNAKLWKLSVFVKIIVKISWEWIIFSKTGNLKHYKIWHKMCSEM